MIETTNPVAFVREAQGLRPAMEDAHVLEVYPGDDPAKVDVLGAIFDGHLGDGVAKYAAARFSDLFHDCPHDDPIEQSLAHSLEQLHKECALLPGNSGACAAVFHVDTEKIVTANLGDVEIAYIPDRVYAGPGIGWPNVEVLTTNHRLDDADEILRVYQTGALIRKPYFHNPQGNGLMPTRSLGDSYLDQWGMSHVPETGFLDLGFHFTGLLQSVKPGYLVAACDGFWDVVKAEELPDLLARIEGKVDAQRVADVLFDEAMNLRHTTDNLTLICVRIE